MDNGYEFLHVTRRTTWMVSDEYSIKCKKRKSNSVILLDTAVVLRQARQIQRVSVA